MVGCVAAQKGHQRDARAAQTAGDGPTPPKKERGPRVGVSQTPKGPIPAIVIRSWKEVPRALQLLQSPKRSVRVSFADVKSEGARREISEIKSFLRSIHGRDSSAVIDDLKRSILGSDSAQRSSAPADVRAAKLDELLGALGIKPQGFTSRFCVTDIVALNATGADGSDAVSKVLHDALREHQDSGRPLVFSVKEGKDEGTVASAACKLFESPDGSELAPAARTARVWTYRPEARPGGRGVRTRVIESPLLDFAQGHASPAAESGSADDRVPSIGDVGQVISLEGGAASAGGPKTEAGAYTEKPPTSEEGVRAEGADRSGSEASVHSAPSLAIEPTSDESALSPHTVPKEVAGFELPSRADESLASASLPPKPPADRSLLALERHLTDLVATAHYQGLGEIVGQITAETLKLGNKRIAMKAPEEDKERFSGCWIEHGFRAISTQHHEHNIQPVSPAPGHTASEILEFCRARSLTGAVRLLDESFEKLCEARDGKQSTKATASGCSASQQGDLVRLPSEGKMYVVSDLEGRVESLAKLIEQEQLLEKWRNGEAVFLVVAGDLIDRSPKGALLMEFLLELKFRRGIGDGIILLAGNHELDMTQHMPAESFGFEAEWFLAVKEWKGKSNLIEDIFRRRYSGFGVDALHTPDVRSALGDCPRDINLGAYGELVEEQLPYWSREVFKPFEHFNAEDQTLDQVLCQVRWGIYVKFNKIFRVLPKIAKAQNGALVTHAGVPLTGSFAGLYREDAPAVNEQTVDEWLARLSHDNGCEVTWLDISPELDCSDKKEALLRYYQREVKKLTDEASSAGADDPTRRKKLAQLEEDFRLFHESDGLLTSVLLNDDGTSVLKQRGEGWLGISQVGNDRMLSALGASVRIGGHQKRGLSEQFLARTSLPSGVELTEKHKYSARYAPWRCGKAVVLGGDSDKVWVASVDLSQKRPSPEDIYCFSVEEGRA